MKDKYYYFGLVQYEFISNKWRMIVSIFSLKAGS